jgi:sugar/nucleoside kinase (ribokinase family)
VKTGSKILVIGEVLVEFIAHDPGMGFREPLTLSGPFPSGAPAIFIDQVAKLGQPCGIASCVGNDDFAHVNLDRLQRDGVDISAIGFHPRAATGSAFVRYRADGDRDFVFNLLASACGTIPRSPAVDTAIAEAGHLHVMGSSLYDPSITALTEDAIDAIKAAGGTVSFDPNLRKELAGAPGTRAALLRVLQRCDLFLPSGPELTLLTDAQDEQQAIEEILAMGVQAVVVKRGDEGADYHDAGQSLRAPAFPATEVDPTGAGDCFSATFVVSWLSGAEPRDALELASASGALAVQKRGPMEGTSTRAELAEFMARSRETAA